MIYQVPAWDHDDASPGLSSAQLEAALSRPEPDRGDALGALDRLYDRVLIALYGLACAIAGLVLGALLS